MKCQKKIWEKQKKTPQKKQDFMLFFTA